jgi:hypothetical protein
MKSYNKQNVVAYDMLKIICLLVGVTANRRTRFPLFAYETLAAERYGLEFVHDSESISLLKKFHLTKPLLIRKPNSFSVSVLFEMERKLYLLKKRKKATNLYYA